MARALQGHELGQRFGGPALRVHQARALELQSRVFGAFTEPVFDRGQGCTEALQICIGATYREPGLGGQCPVGDRRRLLFRGVEVAGRGK